MAYFIFTKNSDNIEGSIYKIAENLNDFNCLNISQSDYKIIEDSESNFNLIKLIISIQKNIITIILYIQI
jgi:hypothetical protein